MISMSTKRKPLLRDAHLSNTVDTERRYPSRHGISDHPSQETHRCQMKNAHDFEGLSDGVSNLDVALDAVAKDDNDFMCRNVSTSSSSALGRSSFPKVFDEHQIGMGGSAGGFGTEQTTAPPLVKTTTSQHEVSSSDQPTSSKARLKLLTALEDTSIFLGGLIKHPVESNRHFSILRHSSGIVYYKGPSTSLAISIFSDRSVPRDRRLWLQLKGWSGKTGMAAKGLFRFNNDWINVTPQHQISAEELAPLDERAWQRDIKKFFSKASTTQQKHILRETVMIRIPFEATDGYFRIVLTNADSKSILCPSPVFRVASTSLSASSLKGASFSTLPIEVGVKVAQTVANNVATGVVGPVVTSVRDRVTAAAPVMQYSSYAQTAWNTSGMQHRVDAVNKQYDNKQAEVEAQGDLVQASVTSIATKSNIVGLDKGPTAPYPIRLTSTVVRGTGERTKICGMPTANLNSIPPHELAPLCEGVHFGWAYIKPKDKSQINLHGQWRHAIVTVLYSSANVAEVARKKSLHVYLIHDFPEGTMFIGSDVKLVVMGYLRPLIPLSETEVFFHEAVNDIVITQASLSRPEWGHEETLRRLKTSVSSKSLNERMVDLRAAGQRQIARVPTHMLGIRNDGFGAFDRDMYGNGGLWVKRD